MANEMVVGVRRGASASPGRTPTVTSAPSADLAPARPGRVAPERASARERGAVTAEAAAVLPLLLAVTWGLLWAISLAATQVRVVDTAREVARAAARGEKAPDVASGDAAVHVSVSRDGERVRVVATSRVGGPGGLFGPLPDVELTSTAVAVQEPS